LPECSQLAETVTANLAPLGIDVVTRAFPFAELFERIDTPGEPFDMAQYNWLADYADPSTFINSLFQSDLSTHPGLFHEPALDKEMAAAARLTGDERRRAYEALDHKLSAEALPGVPYASGTSVGFYSDRIGCQVEQPIVGIDFNLLCER
jgi:ABC-type oligopeptide transport system substrate-binding subunit